MSKRTEMAVFEKTICIPGVRFTRTAMLFDRIDEETLIAGGAFLQAADECSAWWRGDHLNAYCGYNLAKDEKENGRAYDELTREDKLKQYTAKYSAIWNKEPKTLRQYLWIARLYNSSCRQDELFWTHHVEATVGSNGDLAICQNWLDLAVKNRWSASQLRAAIRKTRRDEQGEDEGPAAQTLLPMELVACRRFANAHIAGVAYMDLEEARAQLSELESVLAYAKALHARINPGLLPFTTNPQGGKESLSAAA